jgi:beta-galactosidase/beta-glucuronidase
MYRYPHLIRLRGFWEHESLDAPQAGWRYCRRFGAPTGLDYHERVWLVCQDIAAPAAIRLNGQIVGAAADKGADFQCDITPLLQSRNRVCLEFSSEERQETAALDKDHQPAGAVRLEIRTTLTPP